MCHKAVGSIRNNLGPAHGGTQWPVALAAALVYLVTALVTLTCEGP